MNDSKISVRYAKALFLAAKEAKLLPEIMKDMKLIMSVYAMPDFREVIDSPVVKTSSKKKITGKLFSSDISDLSKSFVDLVLTNKRESHLAHIARNFTSLYKKEQGISTAEIVVAEAISKEQKEKFKSILAKVFKTEIELTENLKPSILGGFVLRVEDEQFDASVASELKKIKKQLLESHS